MNITASVKNSFNKHEVSVQTNATSHKLEITPKATGFGSSVNGGELLLLSLATCICNDLYREAAKRNIIISSIEVTSSGQFGAEGEPGSNFTYKVSVTSDAPTDQVQELI